MTTLTKHKCGRSWRQRGNSTGHCDACHETFEGLRLFDAHRRNGRCLAPREMTAGGEPLVFDGTHGDGSWSTKAGFEATEARRRDPRPWERGTAAISHAQEASAGDTA